MRGLRCLLAVAALAASPLRAEATVIQYDVPLDGIQAGTGSPGTGFAHVTVDDVAKTVAVDMSYAGLLSPTTNAHIHCCAAPGVNAGVVIPFLPAGFVTGTTSGTFNAVFNAVSDTNLAGIEAGLAYINVHTGTFPGGEIRGQIVPEPASAALVAVGLALVGARRRARPRAFVLVSTRGPR